jgi:hypothetical protein
VIDPWLCCRHMPLFLRRAEAFDTQLAANCKTIRQFDDAITRVAFGGLRAANSPQFLISCSMMHRRCTSSSVSDAAAAGWPSVDAYYEGSSSAKAVPDITIPTLCIQASSHPSRVGSGPSRHRCVTCAKALFPSCFNIATLKLRTRFSIHCYKCRRQTTPLHLLKASPTRLWQQTTTAYWKVCTHGNDFKD